VVASDDPGGLGSQQHVQERHRWLQRPHPRRPLVLSDGKSAETSWPRSASSGAFCCVRRRRNPAPIARLIRPAPRPERGRRPAATVRGGQPILIVAPWRNTFSPRSLRFCNKVWRKGGNRRRNASSRLRPRETSVSLRNASGSVPVVIRAIEAGAGRQRRKPRVRWAGEGRVASFVRGEIFRRRRRRVLSASFCDYWRSKI